MAYTKAEGFVTCKDRQSQIGASSMPDPKYKKSPWWSLTRAQVYLTIVLGFCMLGGFMWTVTHVAAAWMIGEANQNFKTRVEEAVAPPRGAIFLAVEDQVEDQAQKTEAKLGTKLEAIQGDIETMKRQQVRSDGMQNEVYQTVTGRRPPPPVD